MKITPRKAEITAVVELLNGGFETPEDGAKAVIRLIGDLLGERSWRVYAHRFPGSRPALYGPFATEGVLQRFAQKITLDGEHHSMWLHSATAVEKSLEKHSTLPPVLCACGHPLDAHGLLIKLGREACTIKGCDCEAPVTG